MTKPSGARERARLRKLLRERIGRQLTELQLDAGISLAELARCADLDASHVWRIAAGQKSPSLDALIALSVCLGAEPGVRFFPTAGPRLHDRFQAPMVEGLIRELGPSWRAQPEMAVPAARGVVDVVLRRSTDGCTVACECHSELRRLEIVLRRLAEKAEALGGQLQIEQGPSRLLLLRSTQATRAIARAYEATLAAAFPGQTTAAMQALRGEAAWPGPAIVWAKVEKGSATILEAPPRGVRVGR